MAIQFLHNQISMEMYSLKIKNERKLKCKLSELVSDCLRKKLIYELLSFVSHGQMICLSCI